MMRNLTFGNHHRHFPAAKPSGVQRLNDASAPSGPCHKRQKVSHCSLRKISASQSGEYASSQAIQESTALQTAEEQSYHTISMEGCEILVAATDNDSLDLGNMFVHDLETDIFAEPECRGTLPETLQRYAELPWIEVFQGDSLESLEPFEKVLKVYLIRVEQDEPFRLDLEQVYSIDHKDRVLQKEEVLWLTEERDPRLITLRIRPEGLYIQENSEMMSSYEVSEEYLIEQEELRVAELKAKNQIGETSPAEEVPVDPVEIEDPSDARDPIDALNDDEREYDETMEDTPSIDQGF